MFLYIDTTHSKETCYRVYDEEGRVVKEKIGTHAPYPSLNHVSCIDEFLKGKGRESEMLLRGILVMSGKKGHFSAIRSGVAVANALGYAWNIPVVGMIQGLGVHEALEQCIAKKGFVKPVLPEYETEPNIGKT